MPLPIEESRARRRATRARFREKKRAEKREAERREAEKRKGEEQPKEVTPSKESNTASGCSEDENNDGESDEQEGSSESKKSPHVRKAVSCLVFTQCSVSHETDSRHFNSPFPSSGLPLRQNESKCETIHMKMRFTYKFIFMQIELIFI